MKLAANRLRITQWIALFLSVFVSAVSHAQSASGPPNFAMVDEFRLLMYESHEANARYPKERS